MNIIQSFAQFENGHIKSGDVDSNFYIFLLSYLTLKKYYGSVTMYCNRLAYDTFIRYIPYDKIIILENKYDLVWNAYKLGVIEDQTEDFIHVDFDVFIFDDLFKPFIDNPEKYDIIVQNVYDTINQDLIQMEYFSNICSPNLYDKRSFGCGVVGMRMEVKDIYLKNTKYVYNLIRENKILGGANHIGFVLEELTLYFTALANKFDWYDIIPFDDVAKFGVQKAANNYKYTHLWNSSKFYYNIIDIIKNKIKKDFSEYYYLIGDFEHFKYKNKNLVYYNLGFNEKYNKLLKLSIISLKKYFFGDILVITDENNAKLLKTDPLFDNILFMICDIPDIFSSAISRTKIYEYDNFFDYDTILHLDCDTIVIENLDSIFESTFKNNKIGICEEYESVIEGDRKHYNSNNQYVDLYGSLLFNNDEIEKYGNQIGLNSGVFCLPTTKKTIDIFKDIYEHAIVDYYINPTYTMDQPYICYHLMKNEYYFNLKECYLIFNNNNNNISNINNKYNPNKYSILHFVGDIGNSESKYKRMLECFPTKIIEKITNPYENFNFNFKLDSELNNKKIKLLTITWSNDDSYDIKNTFLYKSFIEYNSHLNFINIHFNRNNYNDLEKEYLMKFDDRGDYILYKIILAFEKIKDIDAEYIIYADITDTICLGNINTIKIPNDIIFSSEINKYPDINYSIYYNDEWNLDYSLKEKSNKTFLNSGLFITSKSNYLNMLKNVIENIIPMNYKSFLGDQGVYTYHYLNKSNPLITLDDNSEIFFTSTKKDYMNYIHYKFPIFIHDPAWKYDGSKFIEKFNLDKWLK